MDKNKPFKILNGQFKNVKYLSEPNVRYAIENTKSNAQAAKFIGVSLPTWKKYASMYIDTITGLTLYAKHCNKRGIGIKRDTKYYSISQTTTAAFS